MLWGYLAYRIGRGWAAVVAVVLILGTSFSRVYLGVHFPSDVVAGWVFGGVILIFFVWLEEPATRWIGRRPLSVRLLIAAIASLGMLAVAALVARAAEPPSRWPEFVMEAHSIQGMFSTAGALLGVTTGAVLLTAWGQFDGRGGRIGKRLARFVIGLAGVIVLYIGLSSFLPDGHAWRYLRHALIGFWAAYGAPQVFVGLRLDR